MAAVPKATILMFKFPALTSPAATNRPNPMDMVCGALNRCSRKVGEATRQAETIVDNIWNHIRISSDLPDAAMDRIVQGTRVLAHGGPDKLFQQIFGIFPGEKLLNCWEVVVQLDQLNMVSPSTNRLNP